MKTKESKLYAKFVHITLWSAQSFLSMLQGKLLLFDNFKQGLHQNATGEGLGNLYLHIRTQEAALY